MKNVRSTQNRVKYQIQCRSKPSKPAGQRQVKPPVVTVQVAPFSQGLGAQKSTSVDSVASDSSVIKGTTVSVVCGGTDGVRLSVEMLVVDNGWVVTGTSAVVASGVWVVMGACVVGAIDCWVVMGTSDVVTSGVWVVIGACVVGTTVCWVVMGTCTVVTSGVWVVMGACEVVTRGVWVVMGTSVVTTITVEGASVRTAVVTACVGSLVVGLFVVFVVSIVGNNSVDDDNTGVVLGKSAQVGPL